MEVLSRALLMVAKVLSHQLLTLLNFSPMWLLRGQFKPKRRIQDYTANPILRTLNVQPFLAAELSRFSPLV
jgi:hypothetical protein